MDFRLTEGQESFRREVCQFLQKELTPKVRRANRDLSEGNSSSGFAWPWVQEFRKRLAQRGYIGIGWPREYGGGGKDMVHQVLFYEEMDYHGAPTLTPTYTYLAMGIVLLGTEEQKRFFLPRLSSGELTLFQGYSEREAGSDLANLQCRAVLEGNEFVVDGQKIFSTAAQHADWGFVLVRTNSETSRHRGISILLIDMKSLGVSLVWHKTMSGWWHHEVHFNNVRVPRTNLLGELNQGWYHAMTILDYERASIGNPGFTMRMYDQLLAYCWDTKQNGGRLIDDPPVRNLLVDLATEVQAARLLSYWVASMHARGQHPQHEASLAGMVAREVARHVQVAHVELLGPYANLWSGSRWAPDDSETTYYYINDTYFHFAAGGFDITRDVIAHRGLRLPRG